MVVHLSRISQMTAQRSDALSSLSTAQDLLSRAEFTQALSVIESISMSPYVGADARLLRARCRLMTNVSIGPVMQELEGLLHESPEVAGAAHGLLAQIYLASDLADEEKRAKISHHQKRAEMLLPETAEAFFLQAMTTDVVRKSLALLNKAVELDRSHYASLKARAFSHYALGDWRKMERDAAGMITLRQRDPVAYSLLAIALRESGHGEEALGLHNKAIELSAEDPEIRDERRETYGRLGHQEKALADSRECMRLHPENKGYSFHTFCHLTAPISGRSLWTIRGNQSQCVNF